EQQLPCLWRVRAYEVAARSAGRADRGRGRPGGAPRRGGATVIPDLPPPPPAPAEAPGPGPRGLPAVVWGAWQAIAVYALGNLLIGQLLVGTIVLTAMGVGPGEPIECSPQIVPSLAADLAFLASMLLWPV